MKNAKSIFWDFIFDKFAQLCREKSISLTQEMSYNPLTSNFLCLNAIFIKPIRQFHISACYQWTIASLTES